MSAAGWPADRVERRPTAELIEDARNARTHSEDQVAQIAASIDEFGFANPVLIDEDGRIIAGHGRVMAARKLRLDEVPVMVAKDWTEEQKRAYSIADNKLALNADWDTTRLATELRALDEAGFTLALTGFAADELDKLMGPEFGDGFDDSREPDYSPADTVVVVGPYRIKVDPIRFARWQAMARGAADDDDGEVRRLILQWLRFDS